MAVLNMPEQFYGKRFKEGKKENKGLRSGD